MRAACPCANAAMDAPRASEEDRIVSTSEVAARTGASAMPERTGSPITRPGVARAAVHVDMSSCASREAITTGVEATEFRTVSNGTCTSLEIWDSRTDESGTHRSGSASRAVTRAEISAELTASTSKSWHPSASSARARMWPEMSGSAATVTLSRSPQNPPIPARARPEMTSPATTTIARTAAPTIRTRRAVGLELCAAALCLAIKVAAFLYSRGTRGRAIRPRQGDPGRALE